MLSSKLFKSTGLWILFLSACWLAWYLVGTICTRWILLWSLDKITSLTYKRLFISIFDGDLALFIGIFIGLYVIIETITHYLYKLCPTPKIGAYITLTIILIRALLIFVKKDVVWQYVIIDNATTILFTIPLIRIILKPKAIIHYWKPDQELIDSMKNQSI